MRSTASPAGSTGIGELNQNQFARSSFGFKTLRDPGSSSLQEKSNITEDPRDAKKEHQEM